MLTYTSDHQQTTVEGSIYTHHQFKCGFPIDFQRPISHPHHYTNLLKQLNHAQIKAPKHHHIEKGLNFVPA